MTSRLKPITAALISVILGAPLAANASLFTFDPTGTPGATGDITNLALIDQAPGNALAQGGLSAIRNKLASGPAAGNNFTLYYQANLNSVQFANTLNGFSNGDGGNFFTFVSGFGETVFAAQPFPGTATFAFDSSNPVNYFRMYKTPTVGDNLTGAGFEVGAPILSAHVVAEPVSNFQVTSTAATALDQSPNGNDWPGQNSVTGGGQTSLVFQIDAVNAAYFPTLHPGAELDFSFFNTSNADPFQQIDPSRCVNTATGVCSVGGITTTGTLGTVNGDPSGTGTNVLFQADGNQSIVVSQIPEPMTTALFGVGLVLLGLRTRSRKGDAVYPAMVVR